MNKNLSKLAEDIMDKRYQIIEDFCKTYLACFPDEFLKSEDFIKKIELVEEHNKKQISFYFRLKK